MTIDDSKECEKIVKEIIKTPFNSKILKIHRSFFAQLLFDCFKRLFRLHQSIEYNQDGKKQFHIDRNSIQLMDIPGGSVLDSFIVDGICFKRTFYYAGYEQQKKFIENPRIIFLNHELELKHQKEFARIVINDPNQYYQFIDTEWELLNKQLEIICSTKCNIVLNTQPIGDIATQFFTERGITCIGRIGSDTMQDALHSLGGVVQTSINDLQNTLTLQDNDYIFGTCSLFEEHCIGEDFYCVLSGLCKATKCNERVTIVLRGEENILQEVKRTMHDSLCILGNVIQNPVCHLGGGATELFMRTKLNQYCHSKSFTTNNQALSILEGMKSYGKALEEIVFILCENAGLDASRVVDTMCELHENGRIYHGLNLEQMTICSLIPTISIDPSTQHKIIQDISHSTILEPIGVKQNVFQTATEAACFILSIDYVVVMPPIESEEERAQRMAAQYTRQEKLGKQWQQVRASTTKEQAAMV